MADVGRAFRPGAARGDALACAALLAMAAAVGEASILCRPDLSRTTGFLFGDPGHSLLVAREVLRGARLYADVAYQYGPAPVYLYAAIAAIFGNTPLVYLHFLLACSLIDLALFYWLTRRAAGAGVALLVSLFGALPLLLLPGALLGGYVNSYYIPIERGLMLAAALVWQPPARRTRRRGLALGGCLGAMQIVRFGPGVALGGIVLLVDAIVHVRERRRVAEWLAGEAPMILAAIAVEAALVVAAVGWLPRPVAADVLWPSYVLAGYVTAARYPGWYGWRMGIGQYLNPLASLALLLLALAGIARERSRRVDEADVAQTLLPLFFAAGICGLFRSEFHFFQAAWTLTAGAVVAMRRWRGIVAAGLIAWLPGFALVVTMPLRSAPVSATPIDVAPHWRLTDGPAAAARAEGIARALRTVERPVIFYPYMAGFAAALDLPLVGREAVFFPGIVRPYEVDAMARAYRAARTIVSCRAADAWKDSTALFDAYVPAPLRAAVEPRAAAVIWRDAECRVVRLGPDR